MVRAAQATKGECHVSDGHRITHQLGVTLEYSLRVLVPKTDSSDEEVRCIAPAGAAACSYLCKCPLPSLCIEACWRLCLLCPSAVAEDHAIGL